MRNTIPEKQRVKLEACKQLLTIYESKGKGLAASMVYRMLASGTRVRVFKPGKSRRIFSGEKVLSMPSFGREVRSFAPCRRFAAC
jgi:ATP:corrinoid adenosyltransferase